MGNAPPQPLSSPLYFAQAASNTAPEVDASPPSPPSFDAAKDSDEAQPVPLARAAYSAQAASLRQPPLEVNKAPVPSSTDVSTPAATKNEKVNEKSHDVMVMNLQIKVEMERQMQRLAMAHFAFWHFWFLFIPSAALTMASGVLAFLSTSEAIQEGNRTLLVTVVGCLALVATFLQTLNDLLKYGSRAAMHCSAVLDLKAIYDALDFM